MGLSPDQIGAMSLGQWLAVVSGWNAAHSDRDQVAAPNDEEFEQAVLAVRSIH